MDKLDSYIKEYCERRKGLYFKSRFEDCPLPEELYSYLTGDIDPEDEERVILHLKKCPDDQEFVEKARQLLESLNESEKADIPGAVIKNAKALMRKNREIACPHCGKKITTFKKPLNSQRMTNYIWLLLAAGSFALSFIYKHYFMQCLLVALLFGVKFIVDQKATKLQILVYKTLKETELRAQIHTNDRLKSKVE